MHTQYSSRPTSRTARRESRSARPRRARLLRCSTRASKGTTAIQRFLIYNIIAWKTRYYLTVGIEDLDLDLFVRIEGCGCGCLGGGQVVGRLGGGVGEGGGGGVDVCGCAGDEGAEGEIVEYLAAVPA